MNISSALKSNRLCAAMTGLTIIEFGTLVPVFASVVDAMRREKHPDRKRKFGAGHPSALRTAEEQLFFASFISKATLLWMFFHFSLALTGVMLAKRAVFVFCSYPCPRKKTGTPKRQITSVEEFFREFLEAKDIFIDGTERRVQKPVGQETEKTPLFWEKKATTRKTVVVSDDRKRILILTPTKSGRRHDKRLFDKAMGGRNIPEEVAAWTDTGFQGSSGIIKNNHAHEGNQISSPHGREGRQSSHFRNSCPLRTRNCRNQTISINHRCLQKQNSQSGRYLYASFCRTLELSPLP